jgi:DNA-binding MarR family transcriptional regulator
VEASGDGVGDAKSLTFDLTWQLLLLSTTDAVNNERPRVTRLHPKEAAAHGEIEAPASGGRARRKTRVLELGVLNGHVGYFVRRFQVWIFQDFVRTLAPFDIRPAQYSVMVVIDANPGLSQADLANTLGIERARLVRLLDGLEGRGFTRRLPSPNDRRSHALFLTRDGQQKLKRIKALAAAHEARVEAALGPASRNQMLSTLKAFATQGERPNHRASI